MTTTHLKAYLKKSDSILNPLVILAAMSNNVDIEQNKVTITELHNRLDTELKLYPTVTANWIISSGETFINVDEKQGENTVNLLTIQQVGEPAKEKE